MQIQNEQLLLVEYTKFLKSIGTITKGNDVNKLVNKFTSTNNIASVEPEPLAKNTPSRGRRKPII